MKLDQFIADSIKRVSVFDPATSDLMFMATQIQDGNINGSTEQTEITGMAGMRIALLDRSKAATVTWTNGLIVANGIAAQVGATVQEASEETPIVAPAIDLVKLTSATSATLPNTPVGTGVKIYRVSSTGGQGEKLELVASTPKTGQFSITGSTITFFEGDFAAGDSVFAIYDYNAKVGKKISNKADEFTRNVRVIVEILVRDTCDDKVYISKLVLPRAKLSGNFDIALGEASNHPFEAAALIDLCSVDQTLWDWYICE